MSIHGSPTDQWFNSAIGEARSEGIGRVLERSMAASLARIRRIAPEVNREWKAGWWRASTRTIRCAMTKPKGTTTDEGMKQWFDERGICRSRYILKERIFAPPLPQYRAPPGDPASSSG